ncbi:MAG: hypothetical protein V4687_16300 [Bacteroidota bacterium]
MKALILTLFIAVSSISLSAQDVTPAKAIESVDYKNLKAFIGKEVYVVDSVYSGRAFDNHTLLNIGGAFPNQLLTVFVDKKDYPSFSDEVIKLFLHKKINIVGKLTEYNGKVQIILTDPKKQIDQKVLKQGLYTVAR